MATKRPSIKRVTAKRATVAKRVHERPLAKRAHERALDVPARRVEAPMPIPPVLVRAQSTFDFCRALIRDVPDFPRAGIVFKDLTPLLASPRALHIVLDGIAERFIGEHIDAIVGIEARGFIFGGALAARLNASFVPVRKPGKLPAAVDRVEFTTEYSREVLEMHKNSIREEARVVIVDDVLATGGTAKAAAELVHAQGGYVIGYKFVVELGFLGGRERLLPVRVESCIAY